MPAWYAGPETTSMAYSVYHLFMSWKTGHTSLTGWLRVNCACSTQYTVAGSTATTFCTSNWCLIYLLHSQIGSAPATSDHSRVNLDAKSGRLSLILTPYHLRFQIFHQRQPACR